LFDSEGNAGLAGKSLAVLFVILAQGNKSLALELVDRDAALRGNLGHESIS
jgi:hypothetical protein